MKLITNIFLILLTLASCSDTDAPAEKKLGEKDIAGYSTTGFYSLDGVNSYIVDDRSQTSVNAKRLTYRIQNQDQSQYVNVRLSERPTSKGQKIKAIFTYRDISFSKSEIQMEVVQTEDEKVWLSGDNVGIIIPEL
jgi:hypothetical protein